MKDIREVLSQKMAEYARVAREVNALRIAEQLLLEPKDVEPPPEPKQVEMP